MLEQPLFASTPLAPSIFCRCEITDPDLLERKLERAKDQELCLNVYDVPAEAISFYSADISYDAAKQMIRDFGHRVVSVRIRTDPNLVNTTRVLLVPLDKDQVQSTVPTGSHDDYGCLPEGLFLLAVIAAGSYGGVMLMKVLGHLGRAILMGG